MKVAVSIPDDVFEAGEHLARQLGMSRSRLYSDALASFLSHRGAAAVRERLDAVYRTQSSQVDPALTSAQLRSLPDESW